MEAGTIRRAKAKGQLVPKKKVQTTDQKVVCPVVSPSSDGETSVMEDEQPVYIFCEYHWYFAKSSLLLWGS